jgi:hypothetical protein
MSETRGRRSRPRPAQLVCSPGAVLIRKPLKKLLEGVGMELLTTLGYPSVPQHARDGYRAPREIVRRIMGQSATDTGADRAPHEPEHDVLEEVLTRLGASSPGRDPGLLTGGKPGFRYLPLPARPPRPM